MLTITGVFTLSMHLEKAYLTTTRYNSKAKKSRSKKLQAAQVEHEAWLKKIGVGKVSLPTDKKGKRVGINEIPDYKQNQPSVKLSNTVAGHGAAKAQSKYTGTEIAGIVTTHKSNLMPVRRDNKQAAKDAAAMRRS